MTLALWSIGRTKAAWLREATASYAERLPHLLPFEYTEWPGPKLPRRPSAAQMLNAEADYLLAKLKPADRLYLFDEGGKSFTSRKFAAYLERLQHQTGARIVFLIGGAYGFGESLQERAVGSVSLSPMTLSHQLVRVVALEQLYRGMSILRGLPYHND